LYLNGAVVRNVEEMYQLACVPTLPQTLSNNLAFVMFSFADFAFVLFLSLCGLFVWSSLFIQSTKKMVKIKPVSRKKKIKR
jgi:hypothetical protein